MEVCMVLGEGRGGACLQQPHAVLDGALGAAHAPEDASKDDGARYVAHGPPNVGRLVPAHLAPVRQISMWGMFRHSRVSQTSPGCSIVKVK